MRFFSLLLSCKSCKRFQRTDAREMEIVIAPDKFKDTLTAAEAAGAIADGIDRAARRAGRTDVRLILKPMADGGEGSLGILAGDEGEYHPVETFDALMRPVQSAYAVLPGNSGKYAAVEAASAVGFTGWTERNATLSGRLPTEWEKSCAKLSRQAVRS